MVDIKKYIVVLLLAVSTTTVIVSANAHALDVSNRAQTVTTCYEDEIVEFDDEEGLINADEKINPQDLIKGWTAVLARASKYFFVVANKVYIWWYGSARRNMVRG